MPAAARGSFNGEALKDAWSAEEMRGVFNDAARMQRWLDVEAALAFLPGWHNPCAL